MRKSKKALNVQSLLASTGGEMVRTYGDDSQAEGKDAIKRLRKYWTDAYKRQFLALASYEFSRAEGAMMKSLYRQYGEDDTKKMVDYLLANWEELPYIKGFPTVYALGVYRRQLHAESIMGRVEKKKKAKEVPGIKKAQYDSETAKQSGSIWGDSL